MSSDTNNRRGGGKAVGTSSDTPVSLLNSVFFYNGINFTSRGGEEHRSLSLSQIKFGQEDDMEYVEYTKNSSKNRKKQLNLENKVTPNLRWVTVAMLNFIFQNYQRHQLQRTYFIAALLRSFRIMAPGTIVCL